jgi:hypothetical protein
MHDRSASQVSGRTRTSVTAMCVRALRIVVLKSAGNFTRDEHYDPGAGKFPARQLLYVRAVPNLLHTAIFERRRARPGSKISGCGEKDRLRNLKASTSDRWISGKACGRNGASPLGSLQVNPAASPISRWGFCLFAHTLQRNLSAGLLRSSQMAARRLCKGFPGPSEIKIPPLFGPQWPGSGRRSH